MGHGRQRRWPTNAEWARQETITSARQSRQLLDEASKAIAARDYLLAELRITEAKTELIDIMRWMVEAKVGVE